eukprot:scaffold51748_cov33-Tisochrysis_lutea.AAC.2
MRANRSGHGSPILDEALASVHISRKPETMMVPLPYHMTLVAECCKRVGQQRQLSGQARGLARAKKRVLATSVRREPAGKE